MADPRIIHVSLDERTILWRSADIEQERRIAIFDLIEGNHFAPQRAYPDAYAGPYRIALSVEDGRLGIAIKREDDRHLETFIFGDGALPPTDQRLFRDLRQLLPGDSQCDTGADRDRGHGAARHPQRSRRAAQGTAGGQDRDRLRHRTSAVHADLRAAHQG